MSSLSNPFFSRTGYFLCMLCFSASTVPVLAASCNTSPVFAFSQALYLEQYPTARKLLPRIKAQRGTDVAQFLQLVLRFKRAYETNNVDDQQAALDELDGLITSLGGQNPENSGLEKQLTLANIMIHSARLQLASENILRAATLARQGKRLLDAALEKNPDNADALLANGLYQYYTGSENEALGWIMRWWSLRGDKARGREMIESAVQRSADHAFEAARSLLSDLAWNRQDSCRYLPLFEAVIPPAKRSVTARQEYIALLLFCGLADQAQQQIGVLQGISERADGGLSEGQLRWMFEAQLYALAAQGDVQRLNGDLVLLDPARTPRRYRQTQLALAKSLDTQGAHQAAASLYRSVANSDIGLRYRALARVYLQRPYQKPRRFEQAPENLLQFSCGEE